MYIGGLITILNYPSTQQGNIESQAILTEDNKELLTEESDILLTENK